MDAENPVVALCAEGMAAEAEGGTATRGPVRPRLGRGERRLRGLRGRAHYLARQQDTAADRLRWNAESLARAGRVADDRVAGFFPLLPPYVGDLGTEADRQALATALQMLHASPDLPSAERALVRDALAVGPSSGGG